MSAYDRGFALGQFVKADREQGGNYDARWDFADEAKAGTFAEFRRGFDAGFGAVGA